MKTMKKAILYVMWMTWSMWFFFLGMMYGAARQCFVDGTHVWNKIVDEVIDISNEKDYK